MNESVVLKQYDVTRATPMMRQYLDIKLAHADCLLFYRMGDFYEMFFDDALVAAPVLGIALTKRGKHEDQDIPMCGVPFHSCEHYLDKLIRHGLKVAICEQLETPEEAKKRSGYKAVVKREVVRIITPGTITEEALLESSSAHYLAALVYKKQHMAMAWMDVSTGEFWVSPTSTATLLSDLARIAPKELVIPEAILNDTDLRQWLLEYKKVLSPQADSFFDYARANRHLKQCFDLTVLDSMGQLSQEEVTACGVLIEYLLITQKGRLPYLRYPRRQMPGHYMHIDAATRNSLELTHTLSGDKRGSLLHIIDYTKTGAGARLLSHLLSMPLANAEAVNRRLDIVEWFVNHSPHREALRSLLKHMADIERSLARVTIGRGGPRDLLAIRQSLETVAQIQSTLIVSIGDQNQVKGLGAILRNLNGFETLLRELITMLADEVSMLARDGGYVREGYNKRLDELRDLKVNGAERIQQLRDKYREHTSVQTLKIAHNHVVGYYIEVNAQYRTKMDESLFIHKQTMHQAMRYTTEELQSLEQALLTAAHEALELEIQTFEQMIGKVKDHAEILMKTAYSVAQLDVASALAEMAVEKNWVRPLLDETLAFKIVGGRHPVVAEVLQRQGEAFTPNDCEFSPNHKLFIMTGPNMAGKSTYLRQNALIAILAQMGSYVPAVSAHIGTIDRLFSRVGAADDLARGRSTFMVEMVETATILNQATSRSFVILDELGRGTATFDGLSIAWACAEFMHDQIGCRTLFATHYHELTTLSERLKFVACITMSIKEWQGKVIFLHHVVLGKADRSYGIHVAQHAGLPKSVVRRAQEVLSMLERGQAGSAIDQLAQNLPLFGNAEVMASQEGGLSPGEQELLEQFRSLSCDDLSPREAWDMLNRLKALI